MRSLIATVPASRWLVPGFFAAMLVLGFFIFWDYGLSFDERQSRLNGLISLKYVGSLVAPAWTQADPELAQCTVPLADYIDRDYGVAFETPVCLLERLLGLADGRDQFLLRHLCTFLMCWAGLIAVYQLAARRFQDWRMGLLAAGWLLLTPRLFADFFYNDKDAVFMALFAIATNTGVRLLLRPTAGRALVHALACALAIDVRVTGVLLPVATLVLLGWRGLRAEVLWGRALALMSLYMGALVLLTIALWPYLWSAPWQHFTEALHNMSAFRWGGSVLYLGDIIYATKLPWHYIPVWIAITTPLLYLAAGLLGLGLVGRQLLQQRWHLWTDEQGMQDVLFLGLFAAPLLAIIGLHSVVYDGWRQLYFVYPAFLLLAVRGWVAAANWRPHWAAWPLALYSTTALALLVVAVQMIVSHPFQHVYFNLLAGPQVAERFEMDYWGLGFRQDLEYIVRHDQRPLIKVAAAENVFPSAELNILMLPPRQRQRLALGRNPDDAQYFVTNYRWHPEPYPYTEIYQLRADGRRIHSVFQLQW